MSRLRHDPLTGRSVLVAPERAKRPSDFEGIRRPCPFCPGNEAETPAPLLVVPPQGPWRVRVVPNRFPVLTPLPPPGDAAGAHEVIIETSAHDRSLSQLSITELVEVVSAWRSRLVALEADPRHAQVVLFKNHGAAAGATLVHEHSQLLALPVVPPEQERHAAEVVALHERTGDCATCVLVEEERSDATRICAQNEAFVALCPKTSRKAFECAIYPRFHVSSLTSIEPSRHEPLAELLSEILRRLASACGDPAYNLILQCAPRALRGSLAFHFRIELLPAIGRMAGFEWGTGMFINPMPPEEAAARLRAVTI